MRIALIAHDKKKPDMLEFAKENEFFLSQHVLYATGTSTGDNIINHDLRNGAYIVRTYNNSFVKNVKVIVER